MTIPGDAILSVIAAESGIPQDKLDPASTLQALDIGSLDIASAIFELEDRFGIEVDPDKISPEFTLTQFIAHVQGIAETAAKP
jgi:acyl carrier protein